MSYAPILAILLLAVVLTGCKKQTVEPRWKPGEFVRSVLTNQRGQVVWSACGAERNKCYYNVRFAGVSISTNTRLMGNDDPIDMQPLVEVKYLREYELVQP